MKIYLLLLNLVTVVCFTVGLKYQNLSALINELSVGIQAETNILYNYQEDFIHTDILTETVYPKLLITKNITTEWHHKFGSCVLSIVFLGDDTLSESLGEVLLSTLQHWRYTDILFVTSVEASPNRQMKYHELFEWCWSNGFYNVLLTHINHTGLLTLQPFPTLSVKSNTLVNYLKEHNNWQNFKGYGIRVCASHHPARAYIAYKENGELVLSGIDVDSIKLFIEHFNATLLLSLRSYNNCIIALETKNADISATLMTQNERVKTTHSLMLYMGYLMVPAGQELDRFKLFLAPFSRNVWLLLISSVLYITVMFSLIDRLQYGIWQVGSYMLIAVSSFLARDIPMEKFPRRVKRFVFFILLISGGIITTFYLALLSSILNANVYERDIKEYTDLKERNIDFMITDVDFWAFKIYGLSSTLRERLTLVDHNEFTRNRNSMNIKHAYFCYMDVCEILKHQQIFLLRKRMNFLPKPIVSVWGGFGIMNGWIFEQTFNRYVQRAFELGFNERFRRDAKNTAIRYGIISFFKTEYYEVKPLGIDYFEMPAILLGIGYLVALITFILEFLYHNFSERR
ncbi:uncharacterized protein LOC119674261 [Teleopsis dalmanni]|uniref:uncharacterized protein LOC119674261 n=2 Tax=Teleopsis dalmanni TaxID=139649 RepID=UPI0018CC83E3|nr:uncharacterized protein LOC119674261 [Teleopsis dalmanni]